MPKALRVCHTGLSSGEHELPEATSHYVCRVHRLRPGSALLLFDPHSGTEADAELIEVGKRARCRIAAPRRGQRPGFSGLSLYVGRPKSSALERVVRDAVAFGVGRLVLLDTEHSLPRPATEGDFRRLSDLVLDETRQCERSDLLRVDGPFPFEQAVSAAVVEAAQLERHVVLDPRAARQAFCDVLAEIRPDLDQPGALALWIGPEAGFSAAEVARLGRMGARSALLGDFVLRVPTAVNAALAAVTISFPRRSAGVWASSDAVG